MTSGPARVVELDLTDDPIADALVDLQQRAYAVEAELIGFAGIPQQHETTSELRAAGLHWLGVVHDGRVVAALAWSRLDDARAHDKVDTVDIERLVVDPAWFRRGLGKRLVQSLPTSRRTVVSTGALNAPAIALYQRLGFRIVAEDAPAPGLRVVRLERLNPG